MRAMSVNNTGNKPALVPISLPQPELGTVEILVRVHAVGVTPTELMWSPTIHTRDGGARSRAVPGHEFSGVVAACGSGVNDFRPGEEVYGLNDWFADGATAEFCVTLPENISLKP